MYPTNPKKNKTQPELELELVIHHPLKSVQLSKITGGRTISPKHHLNIPQIMCIQIYIHIDCIWFPCHQMKYWNYLPCDFVITYLIY